MPLLYGSIAFLRRGSFKVSRDFPVYSGGMSFENGLESTYNVEAAGMLGEKVLGNVRNSFSGMNFYFSGYNSFINRFHNSVALRAYAYPHAYNGLDRRSELLALTSVGHFLVPSGNLYRPVGFGEAEAEADSYGTAVTSLKADIRPSAFLRFDQAVSYEEYESYTPYERQQILMQACVVEDAENISIGKKLRIEDESVPYTVDNLSDGLKVKGNTIEVAEGSGTLELLFLSQKDAELYLYFDNIEFENGLESTYNVESKTGSSRPIMSRLPECSERKSWETSGTVSAG